MAMLSKYRNYILLHLIVLIFGFTGLLGDLITLDAPTKTWYRMAIAAIGVLAFIAVKKPSVKVSAKRKLSYIGIGFIIAAHWITFFGAIDMGTISLTLACLSSATLFVAFLEPLIFKRKLQAYEVLLGLCIIGGLAMIFSFEVNHYLAIVTAIISAALAATFATINGKLMQGKNDPATISLYEMLGGFLGITVYLLCTTGISSETFIVSSSDWIWLLILGLVCTSFAFLVGVAILKEITPFTATIAINLEPVYGIIIALLYNWEGEYMSAGFYVGTLIILAAIFVNAIVKKKLRQKKEMANTGVS